MHSRHRSRDPYVELLRVKDQAAQLFDPATDIGESHDLAATKPEVAQRLCEALDTRDKELIPPAFLGSSVKNEDWGPGGANQKGNPNAVKNATARQPHWWGRAVSGSGTNSATRFVPIPSTLRGHSFRRSPSTLRFGTSRPMRTIPRGGQKGRRTSSPSWDHVFPGLPESVGALSASDTKSPDTRQDALASATVVKRGVRTP